jgi:hypothetical protein
MNILELKNQSFYSFLVAEEVVVDYLCLKLFKIVIKEAKLI